MEEILFDYSLKIQFWIILVVILSNSNIFLAQCLQVKPDFYFDGLPWIVLCVYDTRLVLLKCWWSDSQSSSRYVFHIMRRQTLKSLWNHLNLKSQWNRLNLKSQWNSLNLKSLKSEISIKPLKCEITVK